MTTNDFKSGDKVAWNSTQVQISGTVKKKISAPMDLETHHVAASTDNPEVLVASAKTGQLAAHKPTALKRAVGVKSASVK